MIGIIVAQPCSALQHLLQMLSAPMVVWLAAAPAVVLSLLLAGALGRSFGVPSVLLWADHRGQAFGAGFGTALTFTTCGLSTLLVRTHQSDYDPWMARLGCAGKAALPFALWHFTLFCAELLALAIVAHVLARVLRCLEQKRLAGRSDLQKSRDDRFAGWAWPPHPGWFVLGFLAALTLFTALWHAPAWGISGDFLSPIGKLLSEWNTRAMGSPIAPQWWGWHGLLLCLSVVLPIAWVAFGRVWLPRPPAGLSLCALLAGVSVAVWALGFNLPAWAVALVVGAAVLLGSYPEHRYPFAGPLGPQPTPRPLSSAEAPATLPPATAQTGRGTPIWGDIPLADSGHTLRDGAGKRPLVIVCVSGGGLRAAVWTAHVLQKLERGPRPVSPDVRLIFGASGGMLGATHYVHTLLRSGQAGVVAPRFLESIQEECLSRLIGQFVFVDIPLAYTPWTAQRHRGDAIELHWAENLGMDRDFVFATLDEQEKQANLPSLVFSPMMLEDGRRLLISNLNLSPLTFAAGHELKTAGIGGTTRFSQSALEASALFGTISKLPVLSAVRANATFPYVMPIGSLSTEPRRQLVDAGYYDNYGTGLAAAWLGATLDDPSRRAFLERCSGVLVIQIRDGVLDLTLPLDQAPGKATPRAAEELLGPVRALFGFQGAVQLFENDEDLAAVGARCEFELGLPFATVSFEFGGTAALSWALSHQDLARLRQWANGERVLSRVGEVHAWLAEPHLSMR